MTRLSTSKARDEFTDVLAPVAKTGERVVLHRRGANLAAIVSLEDLALLEEWENRLDVEEAERRLANPREVPIPYETARKELVLR